MSRHDLLRRLHAAQVGALLICLFASSAGVLSVFLTIAKFRSEYRCDAWLLTACSFWDWFDCNRVFDSYWATPFYRLPISVYATAYYFVLFGLALSALKSPARLLPVVRPLILWLVWVGVAVVAFLAFYAYVVVESACSYCVVIYGLTLAIFFSASVMNPQGHRAGLLALFTPTRSRGSVLLLVGLAFMALVSAQMVQYLRNATRVDFDRCMSEGGLLPESVVGYPAQQPEAQISVFMDLACEFCRREYEVWRDFVAANPGRYRLAVYHYARAGDCVPPDFPWYSAKAEKNFSCDAAQAVECAERELPGAGVRMVDALFALQGQDAPLFDFLRLSEAARAAGLTDVPVEEMNHPFLDCLRNHHTAAFIQEHARFAMDQSLRSTPVTYFTFFKKDGSTVPRMIHIKGAKQYGSIERALAAARATAEGGVSQPLRE